MITFKTFAEDDLSACTQAFVTTFNAAPWHDEWTAETASLYIADFVHTPNFHGILAMDNAQVIGFIFGVTRHWWQGKEFYIHEMGVLPQFQGQGVGGQLLAQLTAALSDQAIRYLSLLTDRGCPAEAFYQKNGFKAVERLVFYSKDL